MNIPLKQKCEKCGADVYFEVGLDDHTPSWKCSCGNEAVLTFDLDFTLGYKLLLRSHFEIFQRHDYPMSIVLSAMALDCELSRLFRKWTRLPVQKTGQTPPDDEHIETLLRKFQSVREKIQEVSRQLYPEGLDDFIRNEEELRETIESRFPSIHIGTLADDIQKTVFWPRNRILHIGFTGYKYEDAARCYSIAYITLIALTRMDRAKRRSP